MSYIAHHIAQLKRKPGLIVFDLDETLWPFDQSGDMRQPYHKLPNGWVVDSRGVHMTPYPGADRVLAEIHAAGIPMAAASRTDYAQAAESLIDLLGWTHYFTYMELYRGNETCTLRAIKEGLRSSLP